MRRSLPFSPLFIGEGSSTDGESAREPDYERFQSPLHRGRVFNIEIGLELCGRICLSVPSSSGKGLQQKCALGRANLKHLLSVPSSSGKGLQPRIRRVSSTFG